MITLYQLASSPFTDKVRRALNFQGIAFELHEVYRTDIEEIAAAYQPRVATVLEPNHSLVSQQWVDVIPGCGESYGEFTGWGLIRLSCTPPSDEYLGASEVNRISERKAVLYSDVHKEMGAPEDWDWDLVNQCYRQVTKIIRSFSVAKHDNYFVLPQARQLQQQGVELV